MTQERRPTHQHQDDTQASTVAWAEWRCLCGCYICSYNPAVSTHLQRKCPRCKSQNVLIRIVQAVEAA